MVSMSTAAGVNRLWAGFLSHLNLLALAVGLSACGRKGRLIAPENSSYPRPYPPVSFPEPRPAPGGDADAPFLPNAAPAPETTPR